MLILCYNVTMLVDLSPFVKPNSTVAVALSGGRDSMALLHYMLSLKLKYHFNVIALNVEHGIRGETSKNDTSFVKNYCKQNNVELLCFSVDSIKTAKQYKLSIEQAARKLRYDCFFNAINDKKCDVVATAHHQSDLCESVLLNILRGSGVKGAIGIKSNFENKIIRPFLSVSKQEIDNYVKENDIPFVTDETNFSDEYTRNFLRLNVMPIIKKAFPEAEKSIARFSEISEIENDFMESTALKAVNISSDGVKITLPLHPAILSRATIIALKNLGVEKDWEKAHIDAVINLSNLNNGSRINLLNGIIVAKEYGELTFYKQRASSDIELPFSVGVIDIYGQSVTIEKVKKPQDLKDGFYADLNKIPNSAVIRFKRDGDTFTKFGGGTKPLGEYLCDLKIPLRTRDFIPVIADGKTILAIVGIAISEKIKVENHTVETIKVY